MTLKNSLPIPKFLRNSLQPGILQPIFFAQGVNSAISVQIRQTPVAEHGLEGIASLTTSHHRTYKCLGVSPTNRSREKQGIRFLTVMPHTYERRSSNLVLHRKRASDCVSVKVLSDLQGGSFDSRLTTVAGGLPQEIASLPESANHTLPIIPIGN
jgi:hypothetical protein